MMFRTGEIHFIIVTRAMLEHCSHSFISLYPHVLLEDPVSLAAAALYKMYPLLQWSTSYPTTSTSTTTTTLFCFYHQRFVLELIHHAANSSHSRLKSNVRGKHSFRHARRNLKLQWKKIWRWEFKVEKIHQDQGEYLVVKGEIPDTGGKPKNQHGEMLLLHLQFFPSLANLQCEMERERICRSYHTPSVEKYGLIQDRKESQAVN